MFSKHFKVKFYMSRMEILQHPTFYSLIFLIKSNYEYTLRECPSCPPFQMASHFPPAAQQIIIITFYCKGNLFPPANK